MSGLHGSIPESDELARRAAELIRARLARDPGVGRTADPAAVSALLDGAITDDGLGVDSAWARFADVVVPHGFSLDSSRFLAFIPASPSVASVWMDAVVGAMTFSAESWLEAPGAVAAERQVVELFAREAGFPADAGGCFMTGGSIGNLSALAVARDRAGARRRVLVADTAHASVANALHLLGMEATTVPTGADCRLTAGALRAAIGGLGDVAAIVASAGSTNAGVVDDLAGCASVAEECGAWLHVDGAYGLAAMLLPELRRRFDGIERADSFIVDPHKWLFAPLGSCALVYRRPWLARELHTQRGPYIDVLHNDGDAYNPSDLGFQLTRRASGLPVWFALAVHGVDAHRDAMRRSLDLARSLTTAIDSLPHADVVLPPELGVVLFRRDGWGAAEWTAWAMRLLDDQIAYVAPTTHRGETVGRVVFLHPETPDSIVDQLVASLR
jgi:aromatic-L-amino-acid decarboxylase